MPGTEEYGLGRVNDGHRLQVPSGNTCLVKRPGVEGLIAAGLIDNLDQLTALVKTEHFDALDPRSKVGKKEAASIADKLLSDLPKVKDLFGLIDRIVLHVVIKPALTPVPEPVLVDSGEVDVNGDPVILKHYPERDDSLLYVDDVDFSDKMAIFNFVVGGVNDLKPFRDGPTEDVVDLPDVLAVPVPAKRASRSKRSARSVQS